jgi:hypothetical protein
MKTQDMYESYKNYVLKYKQIINDLNELLKDSTIKGVCFKKSENAIETINFELTYEDVTAKGSITIKEVFMFLEEQNYDMDSIKQGIYELVLKKAKNNLLSKMYEKKP